jgi:hypothetical protein
MLPTNDRGPPKRARPLSRFEKATIAVGIASVLAILGTIPHDGMLASAAHAWFGKSKPEVTAANSTDPPLCIVRSRDGLVDVAADLAKALGKAATSSQTCAGSAVIVEKLKIDIEPPLPDSSASYIQFSAEAVVRAQVSRRSNPAGPPQIVEGKGHGADTDRSQAKHNARDAAILNLASQLQAIKA